MTPFPFRRCFQLCLPALIVGALLRVCLMCAIPEGFSGSDTRSYTHAADVFWGGLPHHHYRLRIDEKRRWLYPVLVLPLPALPVSPACSIPFFQHLIGLAALLGIGWVAGNLTVYRKLWVPLVTIACAIWPRMLWLEHGIGADSIFLAAFVLAVALAFPAGSLRDRKRLFLFLAAAAVVVAIKPHGRGIWLGCLGVAALVAGNPFRWGRKCWGAIAAGVLIILTSGEKRQANWLLLDSVLPLVNLDGQSWKEYRQALKSVVLEARTDINQYPWRQVKYKEPLGNDDPTKIDPVWASLTRRDAEFCKVTGDLDREAVIHHPFREAQFTLTKIGIAFCDGPGALFDPAAFWRVQHPLFESRWPREEERLHLLLGMDQPHYEAMVRERESRRNLTAPFLQFVTRHIDWARDHADRVTGKHWLSVGWLGAFALFGLLMALTPARFVKTAALWLPTALYLVVVYAVGDRLGRYILPVEWAGMVLAAIGIDAVLVFVASFWNKRRQGIDRSPAATSAAPGAPSKP